MSSLDCGFVAQVTKLSGVGESHACGRACPRVECTRAHPHGGTPAPGVKGPPACSGPRGLAELENFHVDDRAGGA